MPERLLSVGILRKREQDERVLAQRADIASAATIVSNRRSSTGTNTREDATNIATRAGNLRQPASGSACLGSGRVGPADVD